MSKEKKKFNLFKVANLPIIGIVLLILLAVFALWFNNKNSWQADAAIMAEIYFDGEYRVGNGEWHKIVEGEHIPATKGDVTLKGNFHLRLPDGEYIGIYADEVPIALYTDHLSFAVYQNGEMLYMNDMENKELFGKSSCGISWSAFTMIPGHEDPIEIVIHNPHRFGNENAIDDMLARTALWSDINFEKEAMAEGDAQRNAGIGLMIVSLLFLGTALFSSLIHVKSSRIIWLLGLLVLFAGLYFAFSAKGVSMWNSSFVSNTWILCLSMMFYMIFLSVIIVCMLKDTRWVGIVTVIIMALVNATFIILSTFGDILLYDTLPIWAVIQMVANFILAICLIREIAVSKVKTKWFYIGAFPPLMAFAIDVVCTGLGVWKGGVVSQYVFVVLLIIAVVMVLKLIPENINAAAKAKELEMERIALDAELTESRMSTMMSQIRPHFIYNTLGSIEQLCDIDPKKAGELVHDFAKYLRGNFGELDNPKPILMSKEMEHVHHYVSIEKVRFPDMTFTFEMNSNDFKIPALTVQPIVENAIKHGLMKLQSGGTINVVSYETETDYCVSVVDDGIGFDTTVLIDGRNHVGLRNIRERLKSMVNGSLEIESGVGKGTKVLVKIPKEGQK